MVMIINEYYYVLLFAFSTTELHGSYSLDLMVRMLDSSFKLGRIFCFVICHHGERSSSAFECGRVNTKCATFDSFTPLLIEFK